MTQRTEEERLRAAWSSLAEDAAEAPAVNDEAIWRAVAGEGTAEERQALVDSLASDPAAAESWRLAAELQRQLEAEHPATSPRLRPARQPWAGARHGLRVAAVLAVALALGLILRLGLFSPDQPTEPVFRDLSAVRIESTVPEPVPLPRDRAVLRWTTRGAAADRYTLRLHWSGLESPIVLRHLEQPQVVLPPQLLQQAPTGTRILWQVEARFPDGRTLTSRTFFATLLAAGESAAEER